MKPNILFHIKKDKSYHLDFIPLNKFRKDSIHIDNDNYLLILEGAITNSNELISTGETFHDYVLSNLEDIINLVKKLRGNFYLLYFDKTNKKLMVSTDHWSSKFLYYSILEKNEIIVSDSLDKIFDKRKELGYKNTFDEEAAYMLLTFAYMLEDKTLEVNTHKIGPASLLTLTQDGIINEEIWYRFPTSEWDGIINEKDIIEEIDYNFKKYTARSFEKDLEYGYKHLVGLSGGLDSRMVSWVGNKLGYTEQTNFTFSQSNYLDQILANKMANHLKHGWIFKALDHGLFLKDIENGVKIVGGNISYMFTAHSNYMLSDLNYTNYGLIHNGQNGEDAIGCPVSKKEELDMSKYKSIIGYSTKFAHKVPTFKNIEEKYGNSEMLWNYTRCINGSNIGLKSSQQFSEAVTPFMDADFNEFCFSIPMKYRAKHNLYKKWIITKYPDAAKYEWEKNNKLITYKPIRFQFNGNDYDLKQIHKALFYKLGITKPALETQNHMNPIDYWYKTTLKDIWDNYFNTNIELFNNLPELKKDISDFYNTGNSISKGQCLTLISAYKLYFA